MINYIWITTHLKINVPSSSCYTFVLRLTRCTSLDNTHTSFRYTTQWQSFTTIIFHNQILRYTLEDKETQQMVKTIIHTLVDDEIIIRSHLFFSFFYCFFTSIHLTNFLLLSYYLSRKFSILISVFLVARLRIIQRVALFINALQLNISSRTGL